MEVEREQASTSLTYIILRARFDLVGSNATEHPVVGRDLFYSPCECMGTCHSRYSHSLLCFVECVETYWFRQQREGDREPFLLMMRSLGNIIKVFYYYFQSLRKIYIKFI